MSRTTVSNRAANPMSHYVTFKGGEGVWSYWNGQENVNLDSLNFILLDVRSSITGWSDEESANVYSDYFKNTKEEITVRVKGKELVAGSYADKKAEIKEVGGKFTTNLFTLAFINGEYVPAVISLTGASLMDWSQFVSAEGLKNIYKYLITASKGDQQKKGAVKYYTPVFSVADADEDLCQRADDFTDQLLAPYLDPSE